MRVEIREIQANGEERTVATFRCVDNVVTCDNPQIWNHLVQATGGVVIGDRGRRFSPHDGELFLANLRFQYRGPYLVAREIDDGEAKAPSSADPETPQPERAVVVEIPEDADQRRRATARAVFMTSILWGSLEAGRTLDKIEELMRLVETDVGRTSAELFSAEDLRIRLNQARHGVVPPPVVPRLAARADRQWHRLVRAIRGAELTEAVIRAQLMAEYLRSMTLHMDTWCAEEGLPCLEEGWCIGLRAGEAESAWDDLGWTGGDDDPVGFLDLAARRAARAIERAREIAPRGELLGAMVSLRQAVSYDPANNEGRTLLGEVLLRMEHPQAGLEIHKALVVERVRRAPNIPPLARIASWLREVRQRQALARLSLTQGRVKEGRGHLAHALSLVEAIMEQALDDGHVRESELRSLEARLRGVLANLAIDLGDAGEDPPQPG